MEYSQSSFTAALTVVSGIIVFVFGRIIEKFIIEPMHAQNEIIEKIADDLIFYSNLYCNPISQGLNENVSKPYFEGMNILRRDSAALIARTNSIPFYGFLTRISLRLPKSNIRDASGLLIGISNSFFRTPLVIGQPLGTYESSEKIKSLLNIQSIS